MDPRTHWSDDPTYNTPSSLIRKIHKQLSLIAGNVKIIEDPKLGSARKSHEAGQIVDHLRIIKESWKKIHTELTRTRDDARYLEFPGLQDSIQQLSSHNIIPEEVLKDYNIRVPTYEEQSERSRSTSPRRNETPRRGISQYRNRSPSSHNALPNQTEYGRDITPPGRFPASNIRSSRGQSETSTGNDAQTTTHAGQDSRDQLYFNLNPNIVDPWQVPSNRRRFATVQETPGLDSEQVQQIHGLTQETGNFLSNDQEPQSLAFNELNAYQLEHHGRQDRQFMVDLDSFQSGRHSMIPPANNLFNGTKRENSPSNDIIESIETVGTATMMPTECREWRQHIEMDQIWWQGVKQDTESDMSVIKKVFTMDFIKAIELAINAGDFAVHPTVFCFPYRGGVLKNATLKDALQRLPIANPLVWSPLSNRYVCVRDVIAGNTGLRNIDNSIPATSTACHNDNCILPDHICLRSDQTDTCKTGHGNIIGHSWTDESYIPFHCPVSGTACRPASAAITTEETIIASWMFYSGYSSLSKVPTETLLEQDIPDELMDCRLRTYKVHVKVSQDRIENFLKFSHDTSLREHIDARRNSHSWEDASYTQTQYADEDMVEHGSQFDSTYVSSSSIAESPDDRIQKTIPDSEAPSSSPLHFGQPTYPRHTLESVQENDSNTFRETEPQHHSEDTITKDEIDSMITRAKTICSGKTWNRLPKKAKVELREIQIKCLQLWLDSPEATECFQRSSQARGWSDGPGPTCILCVGPYDRGLKNTQSSQDTEIRHGLKGLIRHISNHGQHADVQAMSLCAMIHNIAWLAEMFQNVCPEAYSQMMASIKDGKLPDDAILARFYRA